MKPLRSLLRRLMSVWVGAWMLQPLGSCASPVAEMSYFLRQQGTSKIVFSVFDGRPGNTFVTTELLNGAMRLGPLTHWYQVSSPYAYDMYVQGETSHVRMMTVLNRLIHVTWCVGCTYSAGRIVVVGLQPDLGDMLRLAAVFGMDLVDEVWVDWGVEAAVGRFPYYPFRDGFLALPLALGAAVAAHVFEPGVVPVRRGDLPLYLGAFRYAWWSNNPMSTLKELSLDSGPWLRGHKLSDFIGDGEFGIATMDVFHAEYRLSDRGWVSLGGRAAHGVRPPGVHEDHVAFNATTAAFERLLGTEAVVLARLNTTQHGGGHQWRKCYTSTRSLDGAHVVVASGVGLDMLYPRSMTSALKAFLSSRADLAGAVSMYTASPGGPDLQSDCERNSLIGD